MAGAEHAKRGRAGACPSPRRAPARVLRAPGPFGRHAPGAARVLRAPSPFGRHAPGAARVLRALGPFGRWARSDVLRPELCCRVSARSVLTGRRTRTLRRRNRAASVRDAFRETRECFLPRADGGRAGIGIDCPPLKSGIRVC